MAIPQRQAREPLETPARCGLILVSIAACVADPDALACVYVGIPFPGRDTPPLAILDWTLARLEAGTLAGWEPLMLEHIQPPGEDVQAPAAARHRR